MTGDAGQWPEAGAAEISFRGTNWGFLRVHYTSLLLTVLTLGLYAPWAKLRRHRFMLGNTYLFGSNFEFDATGLVILISRIIVVAIVALCAFLDNNYSWIDGEAIGAGTLIILLALPFAIVRGRMFHARHTLFRGARFRYEPCYGQMFLYTLLSLGPIVGFGAFLLLTLHGSDPIEGLVDDPSRLWNLFYFMAALAVFWPALTAWQHRLLANNVRFGKLRTGISAPVHVYYATALQAAIFILLTGYILYLLSNEITAAIIASFGGYFFYRLLITALFWSHLEVSDGSKVKSRITMIGLLWLAVTNFLIIVFSLGSLWPLARVRRWRYIFSNIAIVPGSELSEVAFGDGDPVSALGAEAGDIVGFDFDAGLI